MSAGSVPRRGGQRCPSARPLRPPAPAHVLAARYRARWCWGCGGERRGPRPTGRCAQQGSRARGRGSSTTRGPPLSALRSRSSSRKASTEEMSANRCQRSVLMRSSPAVCGPRSISRPTVRRPGRHAHHALKVVFVARGAPPLVSNTSERWRRLSSASCAWASPHHHHGFAGGLLVAAGDHGVQREWVAVGHGAGLFHQRLVRASRAVRGGWRGSKALVGGLLDNHSKMKSIVILISGGGPTWRPLAMRSAAAVGQAPYARGGVQVQQRPMRRGWPCPGAGHCHRVLDHKPCHPQSASTPRWPAHRPPDPALVVLAGFMRILTPGFVAHYAGRLINIHPCLPSLPDCTRTSGPSTPGCKFAGCTVHQVTARLDVGPIPGPGHWCPCCPAIPPTWPPGCSRRSMYGVPAGGGSVLSKM